MPKKATTEQAAEPVATRSINVLDVLQSKDFESDIVGSADKLNKNAAARIRAYRYPNGIWKAAEIAEEYRKIMLKQSSAPSTVRRIIVAIGKDALSRTLTRLGEKFQAEVKIQKKEKEA